MFMISSSTVEKTSPSPSWVGTTIPTSFSGLGLEPVLAQEAEELVAIGDAGGFDLDGHWIQYLASHRRG